MSPSNYLTIFTLDEQRFALRLASVERVFRMMEITPLPKAPEIVLGVVNLQGQIVPVVNIRKRFRLPEKEADLKQLVLPGYPTLDQREVFQTEEGGPLRDPSPDPFVLAHFALGSLALQRGKGKESEKHFENALALLSAYRPEELLPESEGMTAGRLLEILRSTCFRERSA